MSGKINKSLFPEGCDIYKHQLDSLADSPEAEITQRTSDGFHCGVVEGLGVTIEGSDLHISSGYGYTLDGTKVELTSDEIIPLPDPIPDDGSGIFLVYKVNEAEEIPHPITGVLYPTKAEIETCIVLTNFGDDSLIYDPCGISSSFPDGVGLLTEGALCLGHITADGEVSYDYRKTHSAKIPTHLESRTPVHTADQIRASDIDLTRTDGAYPMGTAGTLLDHINAVGTGEVSATNPHGLRIDDITDFDRDIKDHLTTGHSVPTILTRNPETALKVTQVGHSTIHINELQTTGRLVFVSGTVVKGPVDETEIDLTDSGTFYVVINEDKEIQLLETVLPFWSHIIPLAKVTFSVSEGITDLKDVRPLYSIRVSDIGGEAEELATEHSIRYFDPTRLSGAAEVQLYESPGPGLFPALQVSPNDASPYFTSLRSILSRIRGALRLINWGKVQSGNVLTVKDESIHRGEIDSGWDTIPISLADLVQHHSRHEVGGEDSINLEDLPGRSAALKEHETGPDGSTDYYGTIYRHHAAQIESSLYGYSESVETILHRLYEESKAVKINLDLANAIHYVAGSYHDRITIVQSGSAAGRSIWFRKDDDSNHLIGYIEICHHSDSSENAGILYWSIGTPAVHDHNYITTRFIFEASGRDPLDALLSRTTITIKLFGSLGSIVFTLDTSNDHHITDHRVERVLRASFPSQVIYRVVAQIDFEEITNGSNPVFLVGAGIRLS